MGATYNSGCSVW